MTHILRFVQVFALGTWLGGILYLSFAVAPGVFSILANRDQAGAVVGFALTRLHGYGIIAGVVYLLAGVALASSFRFLGKPAALAVILMVLLTLISQQVVSRRMVALRSAMGSIEATSLEDPRRVEFDRLHRISVRLEGGVMLLGFAALFLTLRR